MKLVKKEGFEIEEISKCNLTMIQEFFEVLKSLRPRMWFRLFKKYWLKYLFPEIAAEMGVDKKKAESEFMNIYQFTNEKETQVSRSCLTL